MSSPSYEQVLTLPSRDKRNCVQPLVDIVIDSQDALQAVIYAWEALSEGNYSADVIQRWLVNDMKPAIDEARFTLLRRDYE